MWYTTHGAWPAAPRDGAVACVTAEADLRSDWLVQRTQARGMATPQEHGRETAHHPWGLPTPGGPPPAGGSTHQTTQHASAAPLLREQLQLRQRADHTGCVTGCAWTHAHAQRASRAVFCGRCGP